MVKLYIFIGLKIASYQFTFHYKFFEFLSDQNKVSARIIPNSGFKFFYLPHIYH